MRHFAPIFALVVSLTACDLGTVIIPIDQPTDDDEPGVPTNAYHPEGFALPQMHGLETMLQQQDCRSCHGTELSGATGPSCDGCHTPAQPDAWRSDCTFCHDDTPRNLDGSTTGGFYTAHVAHLNTSMTAQLECSDCHTTPADVLSAGHAFDTTPGAAEVAFLATLNPQGSFAAGQCSNLYCHGNGRGDNGTVAMAATAMTCEGCHAGPDGGNAAWSTMSGDHRRHLGDNMSCNDCHADVTADGRTLTNAGLHLDGIKQLAFSEPGFTATIQGTQIRCSGVCHGDNHNNENW